MSRIISSKLAESRRVVIPGLGAFIADAGGRIIFTELLRTDDGVLRTAVEAARGVNSDDAEVLIARFAADIRSALEHGTSYRLEGFGALQRDERGVTVFHDYRERTEPWNTTSAKVAEAPAQPIEKPAEMPAPTVPTEAPVHEQSAAARPTKGKAKRGGVDIFMIAAVAVALVAVGVIIYGYLQSKARDEGMTVSEMLAPTQENELAEEDSAPTVSGKPATKEESYKEPYDLSVPSVK